MFLYNLTCIYDKNSGQSHYVGCGQREMRRASYLQGPESTLQPHKIAEEIEWREGVREKHNKKQQ